ncbi:E3 ubiquitin-protein ligase TRIM39 [Labeo rohita]|uniref:E3 ubiquitin-protein ligase TRIM39 n=1 Tax=Labeo rohita TaxID=84645 RepID=A0ABQ8L1T8_LABRO|nr:E3 ubiquitin-protein ligase TRIM39 [Labeo rohita]
MLSEEQFSCSICLEVFVEPVSTPCGHTFCKACLQGFWNHSKKFLCPMCKKAFSKKPELSVNCVLAEIAEQFQGLSTMSSVDRANADFANSPQKDDDWGDFAKAGDVPCDACIGRKMKATKSCLNCPGSFCEAHLRHHKKGKAMNSHKLVEPIHNLEDKMCKTHKRLLDAYCRNEHVCICKECAESSHKGHDVVSTEREWKKKTSQLGKKRSELKHLIKEREKKLEEIKQSIKVLKDNSQKEIEESWAVYAELQRLLEQSQAELLELITTRQKQAEQQAKDLASGLEHELNTLKKRSSELDALAQTQDRVLFLQFLPSLPPPPEPSDWSAVSVNTDLFLSTIRKSVCSLVDKFQHEVKRLYGKELRKLQNYATQRDLCLSEDGRQVRYEEQRKSSTHSDTPRRFSPALFVLAREGLSSGRHYWEVDVGHKTAWTVGVARGSVRRKGEIRLNPEGGFWSVPHVTAVQTGTVIVVSGIRLQQTAGMASPTSMLAEEQVHCSICLDVFTNPVSIPCGHNFCMACIGSYWKSSALFMCPMCKKTFFKQPDISINTVLREIAEKFKEMKTNPIMNHQKTPQPDLGESPALLRKTETEVQQMIQERLKKVDDIKQSIELNKLKRVQKYSVHFAFVCLSLLGLLGFSLTCLLYVPYEVDITFDPDTANPWLQLSEDGRQMRHLGAWQDLPDTPERFDTVVIVLGREGLSSGRRYWEVQVGEKDDWYIGVARASVNRKGRISVSTSHGYWALAMKKGQEYRVSSSPPLLLSIEPKLKRVGIYVDYEEGQVSFYNVHNKSHIYTFMDTFKEKLFPFFYLYCCDKASDTLMICPVQETSHTKQC